MPTAELCLACRGGWLDMHSSSVILQNSAQAPVRNSDCDGHHAGCHFSLRPPCRLNLGAIATRALNQGPLRH